MFITLAPAQWCTDLRGYCCMEYISQSGLDDAYQLLKFKSLELSPLIDLYSSLFSLIQG